MMDWPNIIVLTLQRNRRFNGNNFRGLFLLVKTFFPPCSLGNYLNESLANSSLCSIGSGLDWLLFSPLRELILFFKLEALAIQSGWSTVLFFFICWSCWSTILWIWSVRGVLCKRASTYTSSNYGRDKGSAAAPLTRPVSKLLPF